MTFGLCKQILRLFVREKDMTVKENLPNYLSKAAMYQEIADFYKYRNPSLHIYFYLLHIKNLNKESQRILTTYHSQLLPAQLRIFQADKINQKLDIFLDGAPFITNHSCSDMYHYLLVPPGKHQIKINVAGKTSQQLLKKTMYFATGRYYTLVTTNDSRNQRLLALEDQPAVPKGEAKIRFLHLSPKEQEIDIAVKNRDVIFPKINYCSATHYLGVTPMKLELETRNSRTNEVIFHLPILSLEPNTAYTGFILDNDIILWSDSQHR
jgi:hypothetical protein